MGNGLSGQFGKTDFKGNGAPRVSYSPQQLQFLSRIAPGAMEGQRVYGIPACVTIAQSILESATSAGWGTSSLFRLANNPFGIKYDHLAPLQDYGHFDTSTWEIVNGRRQDVIAQFQRFPNLTAAFEAHARLLCSKRYEPAYPMRQDWRQFAERLGPKTSPLDTQHCGYSTNPEYGAALITLVDLYHLDDPQMIEWLTTRNAEGQESSTQSTVPLEVSTPIAIANAASQSSLATKVESATLVSKGS
jgi:flagellum-specific peptidoglycan hydrolase FlgJ